MYDDPISEIQRRAAACGQPISRILRDGGVDWSSWSRWRSRKQSPTVALLNRLDAALKKYEAERAELRA